MRKISSALTITVESLSGLVLAHFLSKNLEQGCPSPIWVGPFTLKVFIDYLRIFQREFLGARFSSRKMVWRIRGINCEQSFWRTISKRFIALSARVCP